FPNQSPPTVCFVLIWPAKNRAFSDVQGVLQDYHRATVEEQVARFLSILAQTGGKYRNLAFYYHRSIGTISKHFHNVLRAVISLALQFLNQPSATTPVSSVIGSNSRFFLYFKDCIGAINGTHFRVKVNRASQTRFRGRKEWPTQNVLASCNFDLQFLYVLAGWEWTASDSRILKDALARPHGLVIPEGKFNLGDGALMLRASLLTSYRRVRYHLKGTKRKAPMGDVSTNQFEVMAVNMSRMASGIEKGNVIVERSAKAMEKGNEIKERSLVILDHHKTHIYKEGEIFPELQRYDIPGEMRLNGYKYLAKNPDTTRALFGWPEEYRQ
ncbi:unnamed protein product, partial [Linum tenue]